MTTAKATSWSASGASLAGPSNTYKPPPPAAKTYSPPPARAHSPPARSYSPPARNFSGSSSRPQGQQTLQRQQERRRQDYKREDRLNDNRAQDRYRDAQNRAVKDQIRKQNEARRRAQWAVAGQMKAARAIGRKSTAT